MSFFKGIQSASYSNRGKNIPEGTHILIGKSFKMQPSAKNPALANFIAEFTVESTTSNEIAPGDTVTAIYNTGTQGWQGRVKYLLAQYLLYCERTADPTITQQQVDDKIDEDYALAVTADDGTTYAGYRIKSIGRLTTIKSGPNAGAPFIAHDWDQA